MLTERLQVCDVAFYKHVPTEPDLFPEVTNTTVIKADQLAKDFKTLQQLLVKLNMKPKYFAGPDVATLKRDDYFEK